MNTSQPRGEKKDRNGAHEHFCSSCYGHKTNGIASGWYRCFIKPCVHVDAWACPKHRDSEARRTP